MRTSKLLTSLLLFTIATGCRTTAPSVPPPADFSRGLDELEQAIVEAALAREADAIELLEESVRIPSATSNHPGVRAVGEVFARELRAIGFETRWVEAPPELDRAGHLIAEREGSTGARILLIGHLDTVIDGDWFEVDGDVARGSGAEDMKGGNVIIVEALRALDAAGTLDDHQIIVVLTGDEEEGGRPLELARAPLVEAAKRSDVALAFESTTPGSVTIGRRGTEQWLIEVSAQTGHSSGIFRHGYGASFEAARILDEIRRRLAGRPNVSINPSVIVAGSRTEFDESLHEGIAGGVTNIIADRAILEGDMRFLTPEQRGEMMREIESIVRENNLPGTSARVIWKEGYPSMPPTDGNRLLAAILDGVSRDLGQGPVEPGDPARRGAGDVSFVAEHVHAIDALGAVGSRSHTVDETVRLDLIAPLAARAALLIHRLTLGSDLNFMRKSLKNKHLQQRFRSDP